MSTVVSRPPREEGWVLLMCEGCGRPFHLSARQGRAVRAEKRSARCRPCRRVNRRLRVGFEHYRFWQARFTDAELVEIAECSWDEIETWSLEWRDGFVFDAPPPR